MTISTRSKISKATQSKKDEKENKKTGTRKQSNIKERVSTDEMEQNEIIENSKKIKIEKSKEWNDLKTVERQVRALQSQYTNRNRKVIQEKIRNLINAYEKQVKVLLLEKAEDGKRMGDKNKEIIVYKINGEDDLVEEERDDRTIMSDITNKTKNGEKEATIHSKKEGKSSYNQIMKSPERSTQQSTPRLESLGKIRKSKGLDSKFRKADLSPIKKSLISNATHEKEENNGKEQQATRCSEEKYKKPIQ